MCDRRTDGRTDRRTDTPSYRDARTHLKTSNCIFLIHLFCLVCLVYLESICTSVLGLKATRKRIFGSRFVSHFLTITTTTSSGQSPSRYPMRQLLHSGFNYDDSEYDWEQMTMMKASCDETSCGTIKWLRERIEFTGTERANEAIWTNHKHSQALGNETVWQNNWEWTGEQISKLPSNDIMMW